MSTNKHKVLPTGLHCITDKKGRIHVYKEKEYLDMTWWTKMKLKLICG